MSQQRQGLWIALIGALAVIIAALIGIFPSLRPSPESDKSFTYSVHVQDKDTKLPLSDATVVIDISNKASLNAVTDSNGYARFLVHKDYIGQAGILLITAKNYDIYTQN